MLRARWRLNSLCVTTYKSASLKVVGFVYAGFGYVIYVSLKALDNVSLPGA